MNLREILNKLLKKQKYENSLVSNIDITIIPTRKIFKNNKKLIDLIEYYKNEYRNVLKKRIFTSIDLKLDDSINKMNMNIELILNQCINDKNKHNIYEDIEDELKDFVIDTNNLTSLAKLKLYQDEIQKLELMNICKVIALDELSKEIKYNLSINKRNSIKNELGNLVNIMTIYKSQRISINLEIDNYKRDIEINNYRHIDRKYKNKRFDNADKYICLLPKEYRFIYNEAVLTIPEFTAIIERALEIYVYEHKDLIENYKNELEKINQEEKQLGNKQRLFNKINKIKYIFKLFDLYGYHLVNDEDFEKLYRVKFDILTININNLGFSPFNNSELNVKELEVYKNIISEKLNKIYNGNAIEVLLLTQYNYLKTLIKILDNLFKTGKYFDYEKILNNHILLSLLLALDKENGLRDFFNEVKDDTDNYISFFYNYQKYIGFERKISLDTICKVINTFYMTNNNVDISKLDIFKLYRLKLVMNTERLGLIYYLPEGIKFMNGRIEECDYPYLQDIRECIESKSVIFPSTLKVIFGKPFGNAKVDELILNEGLEYISSNAFYNQDASKVVIPSTLEKIYIGTFNWEEINRLEFTNFKNSNVLRDLLCSDSAIYMSILEKIFDVTDCIDDRYMCLGSKNDNFSIMLVDELGNTYVIYNIYFYINHDHRKNLILNHKDIIAIREYLRNLIYENTCYKIESIEHEKDHSKILTKDFN
ncbi:MAG: hypothetical protein IJ068_05090 [Bacilli bacterium]|nr:hypothetical protein [Bacilli bacterium]